MNVNSYIYKSPSTQAVQVGRLDTSKSSGDSSQEAMSELSQNESFQNAQNFQSTQEKDVKPTVNSDTGSKLDLYA